MRRTGDIYFTDPPYGIVDLPPEVQEQPICGVYRLDTGGDLTLVADRFIRPNGLAFSPDEQTLYIGDSGGPRDIWAFDVTADGLLATPRQFVDMDPYPEPNNPDGMKCDTNGRLWSTGPGNAVWVIEPDGTVVGLVKFPRTARQPRLGRPHLVHPLHHRPAAASTASKQTSPASAFLARPVVLRLPVRKRRQGCGYVWGTSQNRAIRSCQGHSKQTGHNDKLGVVGGQPAVQCYLDHVGVRRVDYAVAENERGVIHHRDGLVSWHRTAAHKSNQYITKFALQNWRRSPVLVLDI